VSDERALGDFTTTPAILRLGPLAILVGALGAGVSLALLDMIGFVVGLMARFGSEQIRGHGIPEAMERILINGSRVQPRLAVLKPISSPVSIGTGGPFGAGHPWTGGTYHPGRRGGRVSLVNGGELGLVAMAAGSMVPGAGRER
jgi:chloride channel protein, CIC family